MSKDGLPWGVYRGTRVQISTQPRGLGACDMGGKVTYWGKPGHLGPKRYGERESCPQLTQPRDLMQVVSAGLGKGRLWSGMVGSQAGVVGGVIQGEQREERKEGWQVEEAHGS